MIGANQIARASHGHHLCLYIVALWAIFSKFKVVRWGWLSGTVAVLVGAFILATFLAVFNYLTPSGRVTVTGRVVEVTPNVDRPDCRHSGEAEPTGEDGRRAVSDRPGAVSVQGLAVAGVARRGQATEILKSNYEQATANVAGLTAQRAYNAKRLADIQTLVSDDANSAFQAQDKQVQYETVSAQLEAAKAAQQSAKLALDSEINGVNTTVANNESATGEGKMGVVANDNPRACRWLCDGCRAHRG
jgi:hypothetical protein